MQLCLTDDLLHKQNLVNPVCRVSVGSIIFLICPTIIKNLRNGITVQNIKCVFNGNDHKKIRITCSSHNTVIIIFSINNMSICPIKETN